MTQLQRNSETQGSNSFYPPVAVMAGTMSLVGLDTTPGAHASFPPDSSSMREPRFFENNLLCRPQRLRTRAARG